MNNEQELSVLRHSAAHLLAHAVTELYPETLPTIGPATADGFFYDFLPKNNFKEEDLIKITERMNQLVKDDLKLEHKEISKEEARKLFPENPFKLELIDGIPGDTVGLSTQGDFYDLCRGGHVESTGQIKNFKLLGISGAYWRADKTKQPLQRISGTAFFTQEDLQNFEKEREEALLDDHRRIGKQLDLFSFHEEGPGFPFYHPKGKKIINLIVDYMRSVHEENNYKEISTPTMLSDSLWRQSGHYSHYKDNMYFSEIEGKTFVIKPMNCPGAILVYKNRPHSYKELPLKFAEFGHVHRHELSGVLNGLLRTRAFTQDDAHIFCTVNQIEEEIITILKLIFKVLQRAGFEKISVAISTKPEKAMGNDELWKAATDALHNALKKANIEYTVKVGEGAFYGPKIEIQIEDSLKRLWQCGTIQVDFFLPENFDLSYVSSEGTKQRPVMIHQAIYGSLERFFAILIEHYKGHLPLWLAPIQARILTISDKQQQYAQTIFHTLRNQKIRIEIDETSDPLSGKIKRAQQEKIPLMLILGAQEMTTETITIRHHDGKQEQGLTLSQFVNRFSKMI